MTKSDTPGPNSIFMYLAMEEHFLLNSPLFATEQQKTLTIQTVESTNFFFWVKAPNDKNITNFKQLKTSHQTCFKLLAGASNLAELGTTHPHVNYY